MRKMKGSNIQVVLRDIDCEKNGGLRLKICKEGARKAPTAFHFSLTHGGGGSPFIFSYKLNHSLNQRCLEQNTLIRLKV